MTALITEEQVMNALEGVKDPEIPVISIVEMGMITSVKIGNNKVKVSMTPTFVGCPAIDMMKKDIVKAVQLLGIQEVEVDVNLEIPWNSDLMSIEAKEKLNKFGIAPPAALEAELTEELLNKVKCPHCGSPDTTLRSPFGSTLCRAIRFCFTCKQGFEQFKPVS